MFKKVLIANRGEIARRVIRTLKSLEIASVAVYSDSDAGAPHVKEADEAVWIGADPATNSYLRVQNILDAAKATGAEAIHPGYGFLAESLEFSHAAAEAGIKIVGPGELALEVMGDKARSKAHVAEHGVPVVPGFDASGMSDEEIARESAAVGFPLLIKPSAGGGGKGMVVVNETAELQSALESARRVAISSFGDDTLVLERLISKPRHIEVQVFGDSHGNVIALGERECTLQRRHQKVIEEAPSLAISGETRERLFAAAVDAAKSVAYVGAGTVEFLISADRPDEFFFIEMNTRLQVEHPVTEEVTGLDLVEMQLRVATDGTLENETADVTVTGHAVEARIYAESPENDFLPSIGRIEFLRFGEGVRIDSAVEEGSEVSAFYDPMIAKMIAHGKDRGEALAKLDRALAETVIFGVETNIAFLRDLINNDGVQAGTLDTGLIDRLLPLPVREPSSEMLAAAAHELKPETSGSGIWHDLTGWRIGKQYVSREAGAVKVQLRATNGETYEVTPNEATDTGLPTLRVGDTVWVAEGGSTINLARYTRRQKTLEAFSGRGGSEVGGPESHAPMPGAVTVLHVADGATVAAGDAILAIEAMKMEHPVRAGMSGTVRLLVGVGDQVQRGDTLAVIDPDETEINAKT